jgi:protein TonB
MTGIVASVGKSITDIKDSIADRKAEKSEAPLIDVAPVMKPDPEPAPAPEPAVADDSGGSPFTNPKILGMAAVAIAVVIAGVFWALSGSDEVEPPAQAAIVETPTDGAESISESALPGEPVADISEILEEARLARDAGQVFNPPGGNAIELYLSASAADPANSEVAAELDAVIEQALALAETAVLESRTNDASAALQRVALADPDNPRLPFLTAQVEQMQLRNYVDDARAAVRDTRFEDAASLITAARSLDVPDTSAIDSVEDELNAARSARQADEVIALASARLEEGRLIEPANDNARYYYELALSNDPNNTAARQGLVVVASKLVLSARAQIDGGEFSAAESLLADAEQLDPTSAEVAASITALAAARDRVARDLARAEEERRAAAERARLEQERADAEARAEAERQAQARRDAEAAAAQPEPEPEPSTIPVAAAIAGGAAAVGGSGSADPEASAQEPATASQEPARQEAGPVAQQPEPEPESGSAEPRPVSISQLKRTRYVAPKYPRSAQRRDLSGHVDVVFTVNSSGGVEDIVVRDSEPGDVFVNSAINAVEKWEFEPVIENGGPVPRRVGVRLMFAIE